MSLRFEPLTPVQPPVLTQSSCLAAVQIVQEGQLTDLLKANLSSNIFFRTMLARWYDLQRKEAGKGIKVPVL